MSSGCTSCNIRRIGFTRWHRPSVSSTIAPGPFNYSVFLYFFCHQGGNAGGDDIDASGSRMDAVGLHHSFGEHGALQEEGIERDAILARHVAVYLLERLAILAAQVGRRQHAGEDDFDAARLRGSDNLAQIGPQLFHRQAAQRVVAAELDEQVGRLIGQDPVEAGETSGRGVPGDSGIDHLALDIELPQRLLESDRESLELAYAVTRRQGIAEHRQPACPGRSGLQRHGEDGGREQHGLAGPASTVHLPLGSTTEARGTLPLPMIQLADVHLTLSSAAGPVAILRGIDLVVEAGATVSVVGPSGSGKSSLMSIVGGIERPTAGRVAVDGVDLLALDEDGLAEFRRDRLGILFQSFHLIPTMTAWENVALPMELAGDRDAFAAARGLLAEVGLEQRLDHYPGQLSGGEQQRVALARALVNRPRLLLADEPTGNLDGDTGRAVVDLMFESCAARGMTLLLITHDASLAARCGRRLVMDRGRLADGAAGRVRTAALT